MNNIIINKTMTVGAGSGYILTKEHTFNDVVKVGDFVKVLLTGHTYYKGVVTKITEKMVTVTQDCGTQWASDKRFRMSTFTRDYMGKE